VEDHAAPDVVARVALRVLSAAERERRSENRVLHHQPRPGVHLHVPIHEVPEGAAGLAFGGDPGVPSGFYKTERNLIAPRLGLGWDVIGDGKKAVRAGVGKYYGSTPLGVKVWSSEQNPWQPATACLGPTIASNPWLDCTVTKFTAPPTPFTSAFAQNYVWPNPVPNIYGFDPKFRTAYSYQWNVSLERELMKALTVQVAYVGNMGRDLTAIEQINYGEFTPDASLSNV
jgi:hypothetical protein